MVGVAEAHGQHHPGLPDAAGGGLHDLDELPTGQLHLGEGAGEGRGWAHLGGWMLRESNVGQKN